jgi:adenosine deaminase
VVTINSDHPAYFGGCLNDNVVAIFNALPLTRDDAIRLANDSFNAAFLDGAHKAACCAQLRRCIDASN